MAALRECERHVKSALAVDGDRNPSLGAYEVSNDELNSEAG